MSESTYDTQDEGVFSEINRIKGLHPFRLGNSFRLKKTKEFGQLNALYILGSEGLTGTLTFVSNLSEVWATWKSCDLRLCPQPVQSVLPPELHCKVHQPFRSTWTATRLTITGGRKRTHLGVTQILSNPSSDTSF